jgi:hypothetical protein
LNFPFNFPIIQGFSNPEIRRVVLISGTTVDSENDNDSQVLQDPQAFFPRPQTVDSEKLNLPKEQKESKKGNHPPEITHTYPTNPDTDALHLPTADGNMIAATREFISNTTTQIERRPSRLIPLAGVSSWPRNHFRRDPLRVKIRGRSGFPALAEKLRNGLRHRSLCHSSHEMGLFHLREWT